MTIPFSLRLWRHTGLRVPFLIALDMPDDRLQHLHQVSVVRTFGTTLGVGLRSVGLVWD